MANDKVLHVTDSNFESEVLKSDKPVLIDFWAPWCGPCKAIAPSIDELANEYDGKVKFVKINVANRCLGLKVGSLVPET